MSRPLIGLANLMRRAFACESLEPIADELLRRVQANADDANALLDLAAIFQLGGDPDLGLEFQDQALRYRQHYRVQGSADPNALKVLALASRGLIMDNMPIELLLEHPSIQLDILYIGEGIPAPAQIPDHDVAIVAVCESDINQPLLAALDIVASQWPRPVINAPGCIAQLSRDRLGRMLPETAGVQMVASQRVSRRDAIEMDFLNHLQRDQVALQGWIIRPVNTHAGHGLQRVKNPAELTAYLASNIADEYFIAPFVDYRSQDGKYRKYRVALIAGRSFPVHMAISLQWMVHYLNADMLDNRDNRREEAAFMQNFEQQFGRRHRRAFDHIGKHIGLDYVVLDCAETAQGELLVFEADNGAVVHAMDPADLFPYKIPAMQNIFAATRHMLWSRSRSFERALAA